MRSPGKVGGILPAVPRGVGPFQFTILDVRKQLLGAADVRPNPCDLLPLATRDTFILVGGSGYENGGSERDCIGRSAVPDVPAFAGGVVTMCSEAPYVLGLLCTGETSTSCGVTFGMTVNTDIPPGAATVSPASLDIGVHDGCTRAGCDLNLTVRIDRLSP